MPAQLRNSIERPLLALLQTVQRIVPIDREYGAVLHRLLAVHEYVADRCGRAGMDHLPLVCISLSGSGISRMDPCDLPEPPRLTAFIDNDTILPGAILRLNDDARYAIDRDDPDAAHRIGAP